MATQKEFQEYCVKHGLTFISRTALDAIFGAEEWEADVFMVGFYDDPSHGAAACLLKVDGSVEVCSGFADGVRRMEDAWACVTDDEFLSGHCLHAT